MQPSNQQIEALVAAATEARSNAYAPFSNFAVGAALLAADGRVFAGANVENSSFSLTICAERSAVAAAVSAGVREITAVAVVSKGGHAPCGACRQVLWEFSREMVVVLADSEGESEEKLVPLAGLLPNGFRLSPDS